MAQTESGGPLSVKSKNKRVADMNGARNVRVEEVICIPHRVNDQISTLPLSFSIPFDFVCLE